jgi:porin
MRNRTFAVFFAVAVMTFDPGLIPVPAQQEAPTNVNADSEASPATPPPAPATSWLKRDTLTGDWGGARPWLKERGITLKPRLTQFYQGMVAGEGDHSFEYSGKADILLNADLSKLGLWRGLSMTVHAEDNFGQSVIGRGGAVAPENTALYFPGIEGGDAFDVSSVYLGQKFGKSVSAVLGKINMIDIAAAKPFMGGAGIDAFWNIVFVAPPSGTVPPYLFGTLLSVRTKPAAIGFWVYDPHSVVNKSGFEEPFSDGVTFRGSVDFPVTIASRSGHQGFVALYSNQKGTDLTDIHDILLPPIPADATKNLRYYFAYTVDQFIYRSKENPKEGMGLFGQFGISDGNPNRLFWSGLVGVGGTGLIPHRSRDNWGTGYYYVAPSTDLKNSLASVIRIQNEIGFEVFYNFAVTPWLSLDADLQIIRPALGVSNTIFPGVRTVIRF